MPIFLHERFSIAVTAVTDLRDSCLSLTEPRDDVFRKDELVPPRQVWPSRLALDSLLLLSLLTSGC
jgi:hypothetical protein